MEVGSFLTDDDLVFAQSDGYLWIGSSLGLFRFDGVVFERYVPPPGEKLLSHNIYGLVATDDGGGRFQIRSSYSVRIHCNPLQPTGIDHNALFR